MHRSYKNLIYLILFSFFLGSCGSVKDGLTLKKKENSEQFLIEKKQPLVMPPDFDEMPKPGSLETDKETIAKNKNENLDLETLIKNSKTSIEDNPDNNISSEIQKKINKKLNKQ